MLTSVSEIRSSSVTSGFSFPSVKWRHWIAFYYQHGFWSTCHANYWVKSLANHESCLYHCETWYVAPVFTDEEREGTKKWLLLSKGKNDKIDLVLALEKLSIGHSLSNLFKVSIHALPIRILTKPEDSGADELNIDLSFPLG